MANSPDHPLSPPHHPVDPLLAPVHPLQPPPLPVDPLPAPHHLDDPLPAPIEPFHPYGGEGDPRFDVAHFPFDAGEFPVLPPRSRWTVNNADPPCPSTLHLRNLLRLHNRENEKIFKKDRMKWEGMKYTSEYYALKDELRDLKEEIGAETISLLNFDVITVTNLAEFCVLELSKISNSKRVWVHENASLGSILNINYLLDGKMPRKCLISGFLTADELLMGRDVLFNQKFADWVESDDSNPVSDLSSDGSSSSSSSDGGHSSVGGGAEEETQVIDESAGEIEGEMDFDIELD